jgi:hypothetical protein
MRFLDLFTVNVVTYCEYVNHALSFIPSDALNFGTKFLEGWVYVTTLIGYMLKDYKVKIN